MRSRILTIAVPKLIYVTEQGKAILAQYRGQRNGNL